MCLDKVAEFKPCKVGYKIMRENNRGKLVGACYTGEISQQGVWLDEKDFRDYKDKGRARISEYHMPYPFGFHVFHTKQSALDWRAPFTSYGFPCVKVEVREPVAVGYQYRKRITVAKQIKIIGIVKEAT